jgi:hypothetical protein
MRATRDQYASNVNSTAIWLKQNGTSILNLGNLSNTEFRNLLNSFEGDVTKIDRERLVYHRKIAAEQLGYIRKGTRTFNMIHPDDHALITPYATTKNKDHRLALNQLAEAARDSGGSLRELLTKREVTSAANGFEGADRTKKSVRMAANGLQKYWDEQRNLPPEISVAPAAGRSSMADPSSSAARVQSPFDGRNPPQIKPEPAPIVVPPELQKRGSMTHVETEMDMARTAYVAQYEVYDVDESRWHTEIAANRQLTIRHPMEPNEALNQQFPLRNPEDPVRQVAPAFSDKDGRLHPKVKMNGVSAVFGSREVRGLINSMASSGFNPPEAALRNALEGLEQEVTTELQRLMNNSRADVDASQFQSSLLSERTFTRQIAPSDVLPHESALVGQYGLFAKDARVPPTIQNGRILGLYMGSLIDSPATEARAEATYPNHYSQYLLDAPHSRSHQVTTYSGAGAINNAGFANTATLEGLGDYDRSKINAVFLPYQARLTDNSGGKRNVSLSVLVGLGNLRPNQQILVNYGGNFLKQLKLPSARADRAAQRNAPPPHIKQEPEASRSLPTAGPTESSADFVDHIVNRTLGQDRDRGTVSQAFLDRTSG